MATQNQIERYDDYAEKSEAAYKAYERIYRSRNPQPEHQVTKSENRLMVCFLACLVLASVWVSGSRTIVEFGGGVTGVAGFVMLELGIVSYAYIRTRVDYTEERHGHVKTLINRGMWLAFAVAVAANLHNTLKTSGFEWQPLDLGIAVMLGFSAPVLAFISGDVAGMLSAVDAYRQKKADKEHNASLVAYREKLNDSWSREKPRWHIKIEPVQQADGQVISAHAQNNPVLSAVQYRTDTDGQDGQSGQSGHGYGAGYSKHSDARQKVMAYLTANPDDLNMKVRDLAEKIGVGKSTVADIVRQYKASMNDDTQPVNAT